MNDQTNGEYEQMDGTTGELLAPLPRGVSLAISSEINQAVATAKQYPRRRDKEISDEIVGRATLDEGMAAECQYTLRRGDKPITGPSIRFAEIVRAAYGNIRVQARIVEVDREPPAAAIVVEAVATDLQMNNAEIIPVRRSIMSSPKKGPARVYSVDMINTTVNAATSIARRNAILAVVPKAVWLAGYQRVIKVLQGDATTLGRRRAELVEAFGRLGVEAAELYAALGVKSVEDISLDMMPALIGMGTAIKEGESIDSVLGRAVEARGDRGFTPAASPLKDEPPAGDKAKPTDGTAGQGEPAGEARADTAAEKKTEPTASAGPANGNAFSDPTALPPQGVNPANYGTWAEKWLAGAGSGASVTDWWKRQRKVRVDLGLSRALIAELETKRDAAIARLGA